MTNNTIRPEPEKMQYIIDCLSTEELLAQLAEEAAELAQKKMIRMGGKEAKTNGMQIL